MFEKLAGNVLSGILSKYFTEESLSKNKVLKTGVWSGFISLQDLEIKSDVINRKLRQKGQPFELVQCTFRHVEITIPWAKLTNPILGGGSSTGSANGNGASDGASQDAVAVFVVDGVHMLFRMTFQFHDDDLREEEIKQRRKALSVSENFAKSSSSNVEEYYSTLEEAVGNKSYTEMLKQRVTSGLLQEIARRLHIHLRDLHIRFEDKESDPENPFAFGITMESMHLQHDEEEQSGRQSNTTGVVSKVAQMNHFAAYWNALGYGHGLPSEHSLLHETCGTDRGKISRALDACIARRGSLIPSPSKKTYVPKHTYMLLPVDGYLHALLSTAPKDLVARPAIDIAIQLDSVNTQLRDFQCVQMLKLYGERRNFNFVKKYRKYRPKVSVMQDPKAWWKYTSRVIQRELKGSCLRWSWQRFQRSYALRERYMGLYERRIRRFEAQKTEDSLRISASVESEPLSEDEDKELQDLEDGGSGDLAVNDIILYRALSNRRRGNVSRRSAAENGSGGYQRFAWLNQTVEDATIGDAEAKDEFERLIEYLNEIPSYKLVPESKNDTLTSVAVVIQLEEINFEMFSPLSVTSDETQLKRIHEKFFEIKTKVTRMGGSLKGDYKRYDVEYSVMDLVASEVRLDKTHHVVASRPHGDGIRAEENDSGLKENEKKSPLFLAAFSKKPVSNPDVDKEMRLFLDPIEIVLDPECQWIAYLKQFVKTLTTVSNVQKFWRELSVAHLNSLTLGKLGLVAKAESAVTNHESIDVDFNLHCPVIRCGMGDAGDLILDLGTLCLKTDKLAGISRTKFNHASLLLDGGSPDDDAMSVDRWQNSVEDASLAGSVSVRTRSIRKRPVQRFLFSSGMSVDSFPVADRANQSLSGSFNLDDTFVQSNEQTKGSGDDADLQGLFYDRYQLFLKMGKITFVGESDVSDISLGIELRTSIQKSVIPTDHTLCKLKVHTALGRIRLFLNEALLARLAAGIGRWRSLVLTDVSSHEFQYKRSARIFPSEGIGDLVSGNRGTAYQDDSSDEGSTSLVNENEFFDANEGADSVAGENSGIWFEDNWIADAESVIDGESRSSFSGRRGRRRQPSVSDMSSVSDHSAGRLRRGHLDNGYLSAENLARLEEAGDDEDDSAAETRKDDDDDSFHSVMPPEAQEKLLQDLRDDIQQSQMTIENLSQSLNAEFSDHLTDSQFHDRRKSRKETRRQLHRAKAELRALQVLSSDLESLLGDENGSNGTKTADESFATAKRQQAKSARAILRARKRREAGYATGHSLVRNLNRELFKGSIIISKLQITVRFQQDSRDDNNNCTHDDTGTDDSEFEFTASQVGMALFSRANAKKGYFSVDQVSAKLEIDEDLSSSQSFVLFAGGTSDTLLPTHLPHLIAHSMEDRFLRGTIDIKKNRISESSRQSRRNTKVRLVVGDLEVSPYSRSLVPLFRCIKRVKESVVSKGSREAFTAGAVNLSRDPARKPQSFCHDLAVRLASIRLVMCHGDTVVGAAALTEASFRFMQISSLVQQKTQLDVRCTNAQVLDVLNLETGRGLEVLGRRDPYNALIQMRVRSQLVPVNERGGWVVGEETRDSKITDRESKDLVRNVHVGLRINPLSIVASPDAVCKIVASSKELKGAVSSLKGKAKRSKTSQVNPSTGKSFDLCPWRWRADLSVRRINVNFPADNKDDWGITDDVATRMVVALSVVLSVEESQESRESLVIRCGVSDVSLIRSSDDWPILEPFSVISELTLKHESLRRFQKGSPGVLPLLLRPNSLLAEMEAVMLRHGWDSIPIRKTDDASSRLILRLTPFKANISAQVIAVLAEVARSMKPRQVPVASQDIPNEGEVATVATAPIENGAFGTKFSLQISIEDVEIQLLRETESKPMALATPLVSFTLTDAAIDYSQGDQVTASVLIRDSALFDLSCGRGIRVIGEDPEARLEFPYFVRVKLYMHYGPQTIRLHVNWGRIQCLVVPSFARSLLDLSDELKSLQGPVDMNPPSQPSTKRDFVSSFLYHPRDVNLILSADAETFECILASKDIIHYVKNGAKDPIGVVTFRWKASLSVAFALDCLLDSSMPWLTLNLDGIFTDEDDLNLFKDFSNRYLVQGSGSDASATFGDELVNAFTLRIGHRLSSFQALRTNIVRMDLAASSRRGFVSVPRVCFKISQPSAGEQRITNPIDFMLLYRVVGASVKNHPAFGHSETPFSGYKVEFAQLINMKANFVDVLLYIQSRSTGGFTDSYRVSIKPILDMFKQKDARRTSEGNETPDENRGRHGGKPPRITDLLKSAPTVCTFHIDGFQVTCVPGGASRLNESPIIKFELSNVSSGLAAVPVKQDLTRLSGGGNSSNSVGSPARNYGPSSDMMNMTLGGWLGCQVTGHYHNRRLVAWEPFIEPWVANVRFGIDLVEVFRWHPILKREGKLSRITTEPTSPSLETNETGLTVTGKERFRDFGRLFRSPFQQSLQARGSPRKGGAFLSHADFCFLMLSSSARNSMLLALYPTADSPIGTESLLFSTMPTQAPLEWLQAFGQPPRSGDPSETSEPFSVSVALFDRKPLNINLTGALIENVLGYLDHANGVGSKSVVPHLIRNDTGMTIRFREVLDTDRAKRGENAARIVLANGSEAPLTLKRSLSQTCDPHRAYIHLEVGNFEDTVGRVNHDDFDVPKGTRSSTFFFKAAAKIPVDAVGVHRYPLDRNVDLRVEAKSPRSGSRALGWIIVRVALRGSVKVVSIESPFVLKSAADADLVCEIRDQTGLSLLWRCLIPKNNPHGDHDGIFSVPADIVPFIHDGLYRFSVAALSRSSTYSHEAEVVSSREYALEISTPPSFSSDSYGKGLIGEEEVALPTIELSGLTDKDSKVSVDYIERIHLTVCAVRIGAVNLSPVDASTEVPEQRMLFFRSPLVIRNFLALPITVQVRVKSQPGAGHNGNTGNPREQSLMRRQSMFSDWEDLGVLDCGGTVHWTGSLASDLVQMRSRFVGTDGDNSRRFPDWSSIVEIPARDSVPRRARSENLKVFSKMKVSDAEHATLSLSVALELGNSNVSGDQLEEESIRDFCRGFSSATRVVSMFVPYWIVDGTHEDLEFYAGSSVAGQLEGTHPVETRYGESRSFGNTLGLAELMDNEQFLETSSRAEFGVLMVGEDNSSRLTVRKRLARKGRLTTKTNVSPWSDPILLSSQKKQHEITVLAPVDSSDSHNGSIDDPRSFDRLVLRTRVINATNKFGGNLGTKLIHIVNRYAVLNETGRDIEIDSNGGASSSISVKASSQPQPFHFDDSRPVHFRFKEYGWSWSGYFSIRSNRREVTMRLRHKMRAQAVIVTVEIRDVKKSPTSILVFRQSNHPPFRLENLTMHPLQFGQSISVLSQEESECDSLLLQYQVADFAWDEPEMRRRILVVKTSGPNAIVENMILGRFSLDKIAPGTAVKLDNDKFAAEIVADGPTRVLRISDASMPRIPSFRQDEFDYFKHAPEVAKPLTISIVAKIVHGIGISVVDFSPKELLYVRLDDIFLEKRTDSKKDDVSFSVGSIKLNNQLWVTPYPVLLKMGRHYDSRASVARRKNRRHDAVSISWRSSLNTHGGYGNVTLLDNVEMSSEPVFVSVDGELASLLYRMAKHVGDIRSHGNEPPSSKSRDEELKLLLALGVGGDVRTENPEASPKDRNTIQDDPFSHSITTAAAASKLTTNTLHAPSTPRRGQFALKASGRKRSKQPASKAQHKIYIERLWISTTKADLSWSGPLPGLVSSLLFKALTFERLPVRLRPFSSSHAYGNLHDHLQMFRSHYLSFWRVSDLLMGLSSNPTFLFRAVIYTFRETCASVFDSFASTIDESSSMITKLTSRDSDLQASYYDGSSPEDTGKKSIVSKQFLSPFANGAVLALGNLSAVLNWLSSHLTYGNTTGGAQRTRGFVRSRNPRLFAHLDGKDLLVEYVEGENAGKALLSRVRMGLHLGEGYFFHAEGARVHRPYSKIRTELDPPPLILMITSVRVLLLTGTLDRDFCSVVWESYFANIVHVTIVPADELSTFSYDEIVIWHLCDPDFSEGNKTDDTNAFGKNAVHGIDVLHKKSVFVPRLIGKQVLSKMHTVDNRLGH